MAGLPGSFLLSPVVVLRSLDPATEIELRRIVRDAGCSDWSDHIDGTLAARSGDGILTAATPVGAVG